MFGDLAAADAPAEVLLRGLAQDLTADGWSYSRRETLSASSAPLRLISSGCAAPLDGEQRPCALCFAGEAGAESLRREHAILQHVGKHPHVVELIGSVATCGGLTDCLVLELVEPLGYDLFEVYVQEHQAHRAVPFSQVRHYVKQLLDALQHLHFRGVVHRNVVADNVLVRCRRTVKLVGFGSAVCSELGIELPLRRSAYAAPELTAPSAKCGPAADLWGVGLATYVLCMGEQPKTARILALVRQGTLQLRLHGHGAHRGVAELVGGLLLPEPGARMPAERIQRWFEQSDSKAPEQECWDSSEAPLLTRWPVWGRPQAFGVQLPPSWTGGSKTLGELGLVSSEYSLRAALVVHNASWTKRYNSANAPHFYNLQTEEVSREPWAHPPSVARGAVAQTVLRADDQICFLAAREPVPNSHESAELNRIAFTLELQRPKDPEAGGGSWLTPFVPEFDIFAFPQHCVGAAPGESAEVLACNAKEPARPRRGSGMRQRGANPLSFQDHFVEELPRRRGSSSSQTMEGVRPSSAQEVGARPSALRRRRLSSETPQDNRALNLQGSFGIHLVGICRADKSVVWLPSPNTTVRLGDKGILMRVPQFCNDKEARMPSLPSLDQETLLDLLEPPRFRAKLGLDAPERWEAWLAASARAQEEEGQPELTRGYSAVTIVSEAATPVSRKLTMDEEVSSLGSEHEDYGEEVEETPTSQPFQFNRRMTRRLTHVAAGHAARGGESILMDMAGQTVLKRLDPDELATVDRLWSKQYEGDSMHPFVAKFAGIATDEMGERYLQMTNLLRHFRSPRVMDVKLGLRSFLDGECDDTELRHDLFQRMKKMYPKEVTQEEKERGWVTKLRWMKLRDGSSTLANLGFRVDGVVGCRRWMKEDVDAEILIIRREEQVREFFRRFILEAVDDDVQNLARCKRSPLALVTQIVERLTHIRNAFRTSAFVADHECIGSSLLLAADAFGHVDVFWIDFGKTRLVPVGVCISHDQPWEKGNHEDGVLIGLDRLLRCFQEVEDMLSRGLPWTALSRIRRSASCWPEATVEQLLVDASQHLEPFATVASQGPRRSSMMKHEDHQEAVSGLRDALSPSTLKEVNLSPPGSREAQFPPPSLQAEASSPTSLRAGLSLPMSSRQTSSTTSTAQWNSGPSFTLPPPDEALGRVVATNSILTGEGRDHSHRVSAAIANAAGVVSDPAFHAQEEAGGLDRGPPRPPRTTAKCTPK